MNFSLTPDQIAFADSVDRLARTELAPGALTRAHNTDYPWDVAQLMAENGLLGITMPEAEGGQGGTLMDAVIAIQTIAQHCPKALTWCKRVTSGRSARLPNSPAPD